MAALDAFTVLDEFTVYVHGSYVIEWSKDGWGRLLTGEGKLIDWGIDLEALAQAALDGAQPYSFTVPA